MAELNIAPATGQQTTTQNPQTEPTQTFGASTKSGGVQPGTAAALLTGQQGVSLNAPALTTVDLTAGSPAATQSSTQAAARPAVQPARHHINPALFGVSLVLCLIAIGLFWAVSRSAKSTTI